jgi:photosystem II stability/assembly factor-like uncharacterized protein
MQTKLLAALIFSLLIVPFISSLGALAELSTSSEVSPLDSSSQIVWKQTNGPPGGTIQQLINNPFHHNELYVLTNSGIVYKSEDKGEHWRQISESTISGYTSIAAYKDLCFFAGPSGLKQYNGTQISTIFPQPMNTVIISNNKIFATRNSQDTPVLFYSVLNSSVYTWISISPPKTVLNGLVMPPSNQIVPYAFQVLNIVNLDNRIIAGIALNMGGLNSQFSNSQLFASEDMGKTWSQVNLGLPSNRIISRIFQDPSNAQHLILTCKYNMMHDFLVPVSSLLKESTNGGLSWRQFTQSSLNSNGIADINMIGSQYYLLSPDDSLGILKLNSSSIEQIPMPRLPEYPTIIFNIETILIDFDNPDIVYGAATSWGYGVFKSTDGMHTWKKIDKEIIASSPSIVLPHPNNSSIILTNGNYIQQKYITLDGGNTWLPYTPVIGGDEIKIDPSNPNHIILIDENTNIYESYNLGSTFTQINNNFYGAKIYDFQIDPNDPGKIYAANVGTGMSQFTTEGWQSIIGSPDYTYAFQIDPQDSNIIYASCSPKTFENDSSILKYDSRQTDNFGWTQIAKFENTSGITSLQFDPSNPNVMYAGVIGQTGTVYRSIDKGNTWQKLNNDLTFTTIWGHSQLQIDPRDKNTAYAGTWGGGTFKTTNAGKDWTLLDLNHTFSPTWLAISDSNPNIIYACDRLEAKIHRSNDSGLTWNTYYDFGKNYSLTAAVAIDPTDPNTIYASAFSPPLAHEGSFIKIKNGQRIADMTTLLPRSIIDITIDKKNVNTVYITTHVYGVYKSIDGGASWRRLDDNGNGLPRTGFYDVEIDPNDSSKVFATALSGELPWYMAPPDFQNLQGNCGVYESKDGGDHWTQILQTVSEARGIAIDPINTQNLYVADMMGGIWVSNNGGINWHQENSGLGCISMTSVKLKEGQIYASTQGSGVYSGTVQINGSIIWDSAKSNKPKAFVSNIQIRIDPADSNRIYAAAYPGGLLRSDDGGAHWNDKNFLTPSIKVDDPTRQGYYIFDIDSTNSSNIWLGVYGKGLFVSHDRMEYDMPSNGINNLMAGKHIRAVKINPNNPNEIYVGTEEGIFVTQDNGQHWNQLNNGLQTLDIRSLKIASSTYAPYEDSFSDGKADGWIFWGNNPDPNGLQTGWSVINESGNYVLQGHGHNLARAGSETWQDYTFEVKIKLIQGGLHVSTRWDGSTSRYFLWYDQNGMTLNKQYDGMTKVDDNLASASEQISTGQWHTLRTDLKGANIKIYLDNILKINYTDPQPLFSGNICFETFEGSIVQVDDVKVQAAPTENVYAGTGGYGIYKFDSASGTWVNLGRTLGISYWTTWERRMYQFSSILFDPAIPGRVYLGHFPGGFFVSNDSGQTWKDSSIGLGNDGVFTLTMDPRNNSILWAGTYNGVAESVNGGKTWQLRNNGMPPQQWPFTVAIDSSNTDIMYATTKNGQNKGISIRNQFLGVVMKSTDGGQNWFKIMNGISDQNEYYKLLIYPRNHNVLFLSSSNGVFLSEDAGATWKPINNGLPTTNNQARDNVADNLALTCDNKTLLLGVLSYGMWKADISQIDSLLTSPTPTPSPTPKPTSTPTLSPTQSPSPTQMPTITPTPTTSPAPSQSTEPSPTSTSAATNTPTITPSPQVTSTPTLNPTLTPPATIVATAPSNPAQTAPPSSSPIPSPSVPEFQPWIAFPILVIAAIVFLVLGKKRGAQRSPLS